MQAVLFVAMHSAHLVTPQRCFLRILKHLNLFSLKPGTNNDNKATKSDFNICHLRMLSVSISVSYRNSVCREAVF